MAASQKYMGRGRLLERLASQVGSEELAKSILVKRGHMTPDGKLTAKGEARNEMTAKERAISRASKTSGLPKYRYNYNPKTNRATKIG